MTGESRQDHCHFLTKPDNSLYSTKSARCEVLLRSPAVAFFINIFPPALVALLVQAGFAVAAAPSTALETVEVRRHTLVDERRFDGVVEAVHRSTVSAQTAGEIIELPFDVNDFVPKGSVVLRIDDTRQKAGLDKAIANEAEARARLKEADSNYRRNLRLIKEDAVSKSQLDKSEADLKSARAQVNLLAAAVKEAREQWEYTTVTAPFDGVLVERLVELGEHVQVGTPLGTGLSLERLRVKAEVPAAYAKRVREGSLALVEMPDGRLVESEQLTFFPYADPKSHTFSVRVELPEGQYGLYPGMLVKTGFNVGEKACLAIPSKSIVRRSEVTGVYMIEGEDNVLHFRQLRVGRERPGDLTEVLAGLETGERIALDPVAAAIQLKQQRAGSANE
jgi:RND family efflux transporter MFP subunit